MTIQKLSFGLLIACAVLFTVACGGGAANNSAGTENATGEAGPEYTSNYICPMHCTGSGNDKPGECPTCGMDYVMNDKTQGGSDSHEGHTHDGHDHSGHDHSVHNH